MTSKNLKNSIETVASPWKDSPYHDNAEKWTNIFWNEDSVFRQLFEKLDLEYTVELSVGHGRHADIVARRARTLVVVDIFEDHLDFCRKRLNKYNNIIYRKCQGAAFDRIDDNSVSSIYCYDAMVHFSPDIVESYLKDSYRILKTGGKALFHHSNYTPEIEQNYGLNPHARNHMTKQIFSELCNKANLNVLESIIIDWGGVNNLDCISLIEKP